jgi:putative endonuclease
MIICKLYYNLVDEYRPTQPVMPNLFRHPTGHANMQVILPDYYIRDMLFKQGHIYIMTNHYRTTFYIGVTSDLKSRIWQHINGEGSAFVKKYKLYDLVYFEYFQRITDAIDREKQLKNWHQDWKINLIKSVNPEMKDLKDQLKN